MLINPVSNQTMTQKGYKHVAIEGSTYKNAITAIFGITYDNQFLPIQLIYGGKSLQSLPRFEFPKAFSLSAKRNISATYVTSERKRKELDVNHPALLLMNVFRGHMAGPILLKLWENSIFLV